MNITILANQDIASNYALNMLLPLLTGHNIHLYLSSAVGGSASKPEPLLRLKFFEQTFFNECLSARMNNYESNGSSYKTFQQLACFLSEPVSLLNHINSVESINKIKHTAPDLIISIRYGVILKDDVIALPKFGIINLHSGLLPQYRGVMASFWALLNNEPCIGCTLHFIDDSSIDTGRIVATTRMEVNPKRSYLWHVLNLYVDGVQKIAETVELIHQQHPIDYYPQGNSGKYYSFPSERDLLDFEAKGLSLYSEQEFTAFLQTLYFDNADELHKMLAVHKNIFA